MTLDNRFTIAKTKGTSLWNEHSEGCFLVSFEVCIVYANYSLLEHGVISDFSTNYRIFSEDLGS